MFVESCALFAKLQLLAPESLSIPDYINCLVKAHYYEKAYEVCQANALDENAIPSEAAAWLAATLIVYPSKFCLSAGSDACAGCFYFAGYGGKL